MRVAVEHPIPRVRSPPIEALGRTARASRDVCMVAPPTIAGDAFIAGMLRDIGELALVSLDKTTKQEAAGARVVAGRSGGGESRAPRAISCLPS